MRTTDGISRRQLLEVAGAAGGLAMLGVRGASAQGAIRIERMAPELDAILDTSEPIRELANGFGGDIGPAEGPVWWAKATISSSTTSIPAGG